MVKKISQAILLNGIIVPFAQVIYSKQTSVPKYNQFQLLFIAELIQYLICQINSRRYKTSFN